MSQTNDAFGGVLCAGFGTRMRPLTETVPKPLLPFLNTPLLSYPLSLFAEAGLDAVGLNLHHLADRIPPVAGRLCSQFGLEPQYAREWEILGTAGGIRGIWRALEEPDATLVISNGDSVSGVDVESRLAAHHSSEAAATLVTRPCPDNQPGGVWIDPDGRLVGLRDARRPDAPEDEQLTEVAYTGIQMLEPRLLEDVPLEKGDIFGDVVAPRLADGAIDVQAAHYEGFWAALDNPELLMSTTRRCLDDPDLFRLAPLDSQIESGVYAAKPDALPDDVEWNPPVFVGPNVEFKGAATVGPYAVIDGVTVEADATVRDAILYGLEQPVSGPCTGCVAVADQQVALETTPGGSDS
jgi:mannose-1-phosphate guanylyltransferase